MKIKILIVLFFSALSFAGEYDDLFTDISETSTEANAPVSNSNESEKGISFNGEHTLHLALPIVEEYREFVGFLRGPWSQNLLSIKGDKGPVSFDAGLEVNIFENDQNEIDVELLPKEIVAKLSVADFRFALGYQNYTWGSADGMNPTDNINSRDYRFGTAGEKIPVFGIDATWYPMDRMSLQAVLLPMKKSDVYPVSLASMIPAELFSSPYFANVTMSATGVVPTFGVKEYDKNIKIVMPEKIPSNSVGGGKWSLFMGAVDFSFSYLYDFDKFFTPNITLSERSMVQDETVFDPSVPDVVKEQLAQQTVFGVEKIALEKQKVHRIGGDFRTNIKRVGLWGEVAYSLFDQNSLKYDVDRSALNCVVGADLRFGESEQHYINFQVIGQYLPFYDSDRFVDYVNGEPNPDSLVSEKYMAEFYYRSLSHDFAFETEQSKIGFATKIEWDIEAAYLKPSIQLAYYYPFEYAPTIERFGDIAGKIDLTYRATDNLQMIAGGEWFYSMTKDVGSDEMYNNMANGFGFFNQESRVFLNATYFWGN